MDRTTAVVCVLTSWLVPATIGAQTAGGDPAARFAGFRLDETLLEAPGSSLGATVRGYFLGEARPAGVRAGVHVEQVAPDSPAARAGFQAGDVVIEFDRVAVTDVRQFERLVRHTPPGRLTLAVVVRKGQRRTLPLTL